MRNSNLPEIIKGDLFDAPEPALAHGCNTQGLMGAGIAKVFANKYPEMYRHYVGLCAMRLFSVGSVLTWHAPDRIVFNLGTQINPGADARLFAIHIALSNMAGLAVDMELSSVGIPMIGCGIGGLTWGDVGPCVRDVNITYKNKNFRINVYAL